MELKNIACIRHEKHDGDCAICEHDTLVDQNKQLKEEVETLNGMIELYQEQSLDNLSALLLSLPIDKRRQVIESLALCVYCGGNRPCYCNNDE